MLTIFDSRHIPTNRQRRGFPACRVNTGFFKGRGELGRVFYERISLAERRSRFGWSVRQWAGHRARCAFMKRERYT